jgi:hypothetical protein
MLRSHITINIVIGIWRALVVILKLVRMVRGHIDRLTTSAGDPHQRQRRPRRCADHQDSAVDHDLCATTVRPLIEVYAVARARRFVGPSSHGIAIGDRGRWARLTAMADEASSSGLSWRCWASGPALPPRREKPEKLAEALPGVGTTAPEAANRAGDELKARVEESREAFEEGANETRARMQRELDESRKGEN